MAEWREGQSPNLTRETFCHEIPQGLLLRGTVHLASASYGGNNQTQE